MEAAAELVHLTQLLSLLNLPYFHVDDILTAAGLSLSFRFGQLDRIMKWPSSLAGRLLYDKTSGSVVVVSGRMTALICKPIVGRVSTTCRAQAANCVPFWHTHHNRLRSHACLMLASVVVVVVE